MRRSVFIICCLLLFLQSCGPSHQPRPGSLHECPKVSIIFSGVDFRDLEDSLVYSGDSSAIRNLAKEEIMSIEKSTGSSTKYVLLMDKIFPAEYVVIQHPVRNEMYLVNGGRESEDGYTELWDCDEISEFEIRRITKRLSILLNSLVE